VTDYPQLIDAVLKPELTALAGVDRDAARRRVRKMTGDRLAFYRGSLGLSAWWMVRKTGLSGAWTWTNGDVHHENFATLAVGAGKGGAAPPVIYDIADVDDEHPAPWRWDVLRLLGSVVLSKPDQKGSEFTAVAAALLDAYGGALGSHDGGSQATPRGPTALRELMAEDDSDVRRQAFLSRLVDGDEDQARLRLGSDLIKDLPARGFFFPALGAAYEGAAQRLVLLDIARRSTGGLSSLGRRRWFVLAIERAAGRHATPGRLRLLEIKERPASALSRYIQVHPFAPAPGGAASLTVTMGGDPFQRVLHGPAGSFLVRTRCHARRTVDIAALEREDLANLARVWGVLLANAHVRGLRGLKCDIDARTRDIAVEAQSAAKDLARLAWELAAFTNKCYAAFKKTAKEWDG
jgi:hypothetical protein